MFYSWLVSKMCPWYAGEGRLSRRASHDRRSEVARVMGVTHEVPTGGHYGQVANYTTWQRER